MRRAAIIRILIVVAIGVGLVLVGQSLSLRELFGDRLDQIRALGWWGLLIIGLAYTPISLFLLPAAALTLATGFLFPFVPALVTISLGSTLAAAVVFLFGRTVARAWVEARFGHDPRFRALDRAVAERGFLIVLLTRLSPAFPYVVLNYAYSLTRISFRDFVVASWIGMLPGTVMYVYIGSLLESLASPLPATGPWQRALLVVGLLATAAVTIVLGRIASRALRERFEPESQRDANGSLTTDD